MNIIILRLIKNVTQLKLYQPQLPRLNTSQIRLGASISLMVRIQWYFQPRTFKKLLIGSKIRNFAGLVIKCKTRYYLQLLAKFRDIAGPRLKFVGPKLSVSLKLEYPKIQRPDQKQMRMRVWISKFESVHEVRLNKSYKENKKSVD